jgi:hypothetical protein
VLGGLGMKSTSIILGLALSCLSVTACSHEKTQGTTAEAHSSPDSSDPQVDPTLPSWAPKTCNAYHKAVVEAQGCEAIDQATRDAMRTKYDAADQSWRAMQNAEQGDIEKVRVACADEAKSVHEASDGKCSPAKP